MRKPRPVSRHSIDARDRPNRQHTLVRPQIAHHAHRRNRQKHRKCLPDAVIQLGEFQLLFDYQIGRPEQFQMLIGDLTQYPDGETGAGERMPSEEIFGYSQVTAYRSDFVFEKLPERLDEGQMHTLGQSPHVMMTLNNSRWPT